MPKSPSTDDYYETAGNNDDDERRGEGANCAGVSALRNHKRQVASGKWQMPADAKYVNAFGWEIK